MNIQYYIFQHIPAHLVVSLVLWYFFYTGYNIYNTLEPDDIASAFSKEGNNVKEFVSCGGEDGVPEPAEFDPIERAKILGKK